MPLDGFVAFTGSLLQPGPVEDQNPAAADGDQAFILQRVGDGIDCRALYAEQRCKRFLRELYPIASPILRFPTSRAKIRSDWPISTKQLYRSDYCALATVASGLLVAVFSPPTPANRMQSTGLFLAGAGVFVALLYYGRAFWVTLLISVILAFLLEPFVALIVRLRVPRGGAGRGYR